MFPTQEAQSSQGCAEGAMGVTVASREAEGLGSKSHSITEASHPNSQPHFPLGLTGIAGSNEIRSGGN